MKYKVDCLNGSQLLDVFVEATHQQKTSIEIPYEYAQLMAHEISTLRKEIQNLEENQIWGFYEDKYPAYTNFKDKHPDLSSLVGPAEVNNLCKKLIMDEEKICDLMKILNYYRTMDIPQEIHDYVDKMMLNMEYGRMGNNKWQLK